MYFLHTKELKGGRRITFAGIKDGNHLKIAMARASKFDQFDKKIGRKIAANRLKEGIIFHKVIIDPDSFSGKIFNEVCVKLIENRSALNDSPNRNRPKKIKESNFKTKL
jgi:hypothetical protein